MVEITGVLICVSVLVSKLPPKKLLKKLHHISGTAFRGIKKKP